MSAYASRRNATLALVAVGLAVTACERPSAPEAQPTSTEAKVVVGSFGPRPIDDSYRRINSLAPSFGGMYWDTDDTFVVVLTDVSQLQAAQNAIYRVFPTYVERWGSKTWRAQLGLFTYSQLADWRDVLTTNVLQEAEINAVGIDQIGNRLSVGVPTEAEISAAKVLVVSAGVPLNAVTVEVLGGVVRTASLEDRIRPAPAGVWIEQDQGFFCTLGPIGTVWSGPGPHYFLTASHCTAVQGGAADGSVFFQNHPPSETNRLAFEVRDAPKYENQAGGCPLDRICQKADAALFQFYNTADSDWNFLAKTTFFGVTAPGSKEIHNDGGTYGYRRAIYGVEGYNMDPWPVGTFIDKVGTGSGWTRGRIQMLDQNLDETETNFTWLSVTRVSGYSAGGDSGAPVYVPSLDVDGAYVDGILVAGTFEHTHYWFVPMSSIFAELGIAPVGEILFCGC
jgi:hypothetical protein